MARAKPSPRRLPALPVRVHLLPVEEARRVLVVVDVNKGYWVGPLYPSVDTYVRLVVEKYAGLSTVTLQRN